jgi:hypothetical protein
MCESELVQRADLLLSGIHLSFERAAEQGHLFLPQVSQI